MSGYNFGQSVLHVVGVEMPGFTSKGFRGMSGNLNYLLAIIGKTGTRRENSRN